MAESSQINNIEILKTTDFVIPSLSTKITVTHFEDIDTIHRFLSSLDKNEVKTLMIAYEHLGSSFELEKSIMYIEWKNAQTSHNVKV
jgi:hypothetical protein